MDFIAEFSQLATALRETRTRQIELIAGKYADKYGANYIADMVANDVKMNYRTVLNEIAHAWEAKYLKK